MSLKDVEEFDILSALPCFEGKCFNIICFCKVLHVKKVPEYINVCISKNKNVRLVLLHATNLNSLFEFLPLCIYEFMCDCNWREARASITVTHTIVHINVHTLQFQKIKFH